MTKKDCTKIANLFAARAALAQNLNTRAERLAHLRELAVDFCIMFAEDNEAFDMVKFVKACGLAKPTEVQ